MFTDYKKLITQHKINIQKKLLANTALVKNLNFELNTFKHASNFLVTEYLKDKICVKICGNLGNQMFIHAAAKSFVKKYANKKLIYDISECDYSLGRFGINIKSQKIDYEKCLDAKHKIQEKYFSSYDENLFNKEFLFFKGYFQCEKYFKEYRTELVQEFKFPLPQHGEYREYLEKITNSNSVLVHFRVRQDYINLGWALNFNYQIKAINYMLENIENPEFFVFADDIDFVKKYFKCDYKLNFVDIGKKNPDKVFLDLELMKNCKHAIIPNSTFSWWAAWLNENPNKLVIAPQPWLFKESEIVPDDWIKLPAEKIQCKKPHIV